MTMDIANNQQRSVEPKMVTTNGETTTFHPKTNLKRSFDVAFLMMPDDRMRQRKLLEKQPRLNIDPTDKIHPTDLSPRPKHYPPEINPDLLFNSAEARRYPQITVRSPRIYDDPTIILPDADSPRSAFTKVPQVGHESPVPPPLSPDQMSCPSMSPPISTTPPRNSNGFYSNFRPVDYHHQFNGAFHAVGPVQALAAQNSRIKQHLMYRPMTGPNGHPELLHAGYMPHGTVAGGFPFAAPGHPFAPPTDITGIVRNPAAAAIFSTLIQPTIATTFTMTAQNVCAKCNISFRMTSDLVYHMRSHHKSEVAADPNRRKREEKLKCPVCNESFRERHHLTRHMTAHQDKASDQEGVTDHVPRRK